MCQMCVGCLVLHMKPNDRVITLLFFRIDIQYYKRQQPITNDGGYTICLINDSPKQPLKPEKTHQISQEMTLSGFE